MIIGLTGGIASGKTFCSNYLQGYGIDVIDADVIARDILLPNSVGLQAVVSAFGRQILQADGCLNRNVLRKLVFADNQARARLNAITHPLIRQAIVAALAQVNAQPYAILSAPLLLENGLEQYCHSVLVVDISQQIQLSRGSRRDGQSQAELAKIVAAQISREERLAKAHYVIDNSGTTQNTEQQLALLHQHFLKLV